MTATNVSASFNLQAQIYPDSSAINGAVAISINEDLNSLGLDSVYTRQFLNAELDGLTITYDTFPTVEKDGVVELGEDKQPLVLNMINAIAIQVSKVDSTLAAVGFITVTFTDFGSSTAATRSFKVGESLMQTTSLGWPADAGGSIVIVGDATLTNTKLVIAIAGDTTASGTGYGS